MKKNYQDNRPISKDNTDCGVKCVYDWVQCFEDEGGANICKTREHNCFDDCELY